MVLFSGVVDAQKSVLRVYEFEKPLRIELNRSKFESPLHLSFHSLIALNGNKKPEWLNTYLNVYNLHGQDYADWIDLYHKDYTAGVMNLSEERFLSLKSKYGEAFGDEKSSIYFSATFSVRDLAYAYVLAGVGGHYNSLEESVESSNRIESTCLIKEEGKWKLFRLSSGPEWLKKIAMKSVQLLDEVAESENIVIGGEDSFLLHMEGLQRYEFFADPSSRKH